MNLPFELLEGILISLVEEWITEDNYLSLVRYGAIIDHYRKLVEIMKSDIVRVGFLRKFSVDYPLVKETQVDLALGIINSLKRISGIAKSSLFYNGVAAGTNYIYLPLMNRTYLFQVGFNSMLMYSKFEPDRIPRLPITYDSDDEEEEMAPI